MRGTLSIVIFSITLVMVGSGCMSTPIPGKAGESFRDYEKAFDARQIVQAFETNRLAAQWEYSGKVCKGFGRIWKAEFDGKRHRIYFEIGDPMQSQVRKVQNVVIELTPVELNRLPYDIRANDIIWVEGTVSRYENGVVVIRDIRRYQVRDRLAPFGWDAPGDRQIDPRLYKPKTEVGEPEPVD